MSKHVAVVGANGFIGKHLVKSLIEKGFVVTSFDRGNSSIEESRPNFNHADHVIHLAAKTFVPDSWDHPADFYKTNLLGLINVLEATRERNIPVTFLSSYLYGTPDYLPIDENHKLKPGNPYAMTKKISEDICHFYQENMNSTISIIRPFNVYGNGQDERFVFSKIFNQILDRNQTQLELQNLDTRRDFIYVQDLVDLIIKTVLHPKNRTINAASGISHSIEDIARLIMKELCVFKEIINLNTKRQNEIMETIGSTQHATNELDWHPRYDLSTGIREMIESQIS